MQFVIYAAGLVPSKFFEVLGAKDFPAFQQLSVYAILVIVLNAVVRFYDLERAIITWPVKILITFLEWSYSFVADFINHNCKTKCFSVNLKGVQR